MTNRNAEVSQGDGNASLRPQPGQPDHLTTQGNNTIFKSGPLFLSSKGIGWTSWKKRWFILTRTSLVFFRSDPSAVPQKGSEVNLTLGGIDLNNSGSVVVKADKKLLTVVFPDGRDGRTFTLKAETTEDLYEWKTALENALAQAPSTANATGQNGIFRKDQSDSNDNSSDQLKDREPPKSTVIGRPVLLALEDVDGAPSFLEKALRFIEDHGLKVEGILRQAADVDDVERRVREYEEGKVEFTPGEDAHVIGDCIKYVLRELPSSPVPASCCRALLAACRTERASRVPAMRAAICDTFPEPNRRLLQRILLMMQRVASNKNENKMSTSAVAACMAPLLLRPLLAGECEIESDFDVGGDGSLQLLQAAAAANHGQTIVMTLLEEYDSIFGEGSVSPDLYTDSEESGSEDEEEEVTDDGSYEDDDGEGSYYDDEEEDESIHESDADDNVISEAGSETGDSDGYDENDDKDHDRVSSSSKSSGVSEDHKVNQMSSNSTEVSQPQHEDVKSRKNLKISTKTGSAAEHNKPAEISEGVPTDQSNEHDLSGSMPSSCIKKSATMTDSPDHNSQRRTVWGRTSAKKNLSMESIDLHVEETEIEKLEATKTELQNQHAREVEKNAKLQSDREKRKKALHERRLALEKDVAKLQEQLRKEKNIRATIEAGLKTPQEPLSNSTSVDEKTKAELEELALVEADLSNLEQKVIDLGVRLNRQREGNHGSSLNISNQPQQISNQEIKLKNKPDTAVTATSQSEKSRSKDAKAENENERKPESTPLPSKHQSHSNSKKSSTKGEERRTQIANELHNMDKGRDSSAKNSEKGSRQPLSPPKKSRGESDEGSTKEGKSLESLEKFRKSESHPAHHSEKWNQHPQTLERGKSESRSSYNADKGR
ncbi:hypothetical protein L6164_030658 [Bauhinia variegata]|uniref:Uncharacterized protein n=1 Tax=Bauhinia variegata TaxID=167791 RepID=A0ACB9LDW6_BAUVA|nr:hypothetical protein L6164_030658 [Bauhinia variegata]